MSTAMSLIAGLGNPGSQYQATRHNAGAWFIEYICQQHNITLKLDKKFSCQIGTLELANYSCKLLIPTTFMNDSGQAIAGFAKYFNIPPEKIIVAHDDLDLNPGKIKLRENGGHGGHNGIRNIIQSFGNNHTFARVKLGIGHPGSREQVLNYVLAKPSRADKLKIDDAINAVFCRLPQIMSGDLQNAMQQLHT